MFGRRARITSLSSSLSPTVAAESSREPENPLSHSIVALMLFCASLTTCCYLNLPVAVQFENKLLLQDDVVMTSLFQR